MNINIEEVRRNFTNRYASEINNMEEDFNDSLAYHEGIKLPKNFTKKSKTLFYLWLHKGEIVGKIILDNLFNQGIDNQNARHLGRQDGFNILQWGDKYDNICLPRGTYVFTSFNEIHYAWNLNRRRSDPSVNWNQIKLSYGNKCAHCGNLEGQNCKFNRRNVVLEMGHKNPDSPLNRENIIPLCKYCNRHYQNKVKFNNDGLIVSFRYNKEWISIRSR